MIERFAYPLLRIQSGIDCLPRDQSERRRSLCADPDGPPAWNPLCITGVGNARLRHRGRPLSP